TSTRSNKADSVFYGFMRPPVVATAEGSPPPSEPLRCQEKFERRFPPIKASGGSSEGACGVRLVLPLGPTQELR
ncbi:hypothetical protein DP117_27660, partial [Brasilonema sp. UFV-L1]|nr:hypothetical protein [Brasilonema sp. UFV-L1]